MIYSHNNIRFGKIRTVLCLIVDGIDIDKFRI